MTASESLKFDTRKISELLQIAPPFLMIDEIELIPGKSAKSVKYLSSDEWFFGCHLPQEMAMPGTLLIEAMLQTLVLTIYTIEGHQGKISYINDLKIDDLVKSNPHRHPGESRGT